MQKIIRIFIGFSLIGLAIFSSDRPELWSCEMFWQIALILLGGLYLIRSNEE